MSKAKPVPDGYHTLTPYLIVAGGAQALAFYERAFGAAVRLRLTGPGGEILHSELKLGDSIFGVSDEMPSWGVFAPKDGQGNTVSLMVYVEDVDALFARAVAAGAQVVSPLADQFHGDRTGTIRCPFGHRWILATRTEDLSEAELQRRTDAFMAKAQG